MGSKLKTTARPATPLKPPPPPTTPENSNPNLASGSPLITKSSAKGVKSASRNPNLSEKNKNRKKAVTPINQKLESDCSSGAQSEEKMVTSELDGDEQVVADNELCAKVEVSESGGRVKSGVCRSNIKRGKVMNLIQAFERILTLPPGSLSEDGIVSFKEEESDDDDDTGVKKKRPVLEESSEVTQSPAATESLHLDSGVASSLWDGSLSQESISKRNSSGGRRSRRNSSESSGTSGVTRLKKKNLRITNQKPFKLRTEQRGKVKEVELLSKIQQMIEEEERKRLRIAQGLPWTTDEPQCLVKPPVKEITRPLDVKLHSDMRAVERSQFDHQMAEKMSLFEQYKMERVRQQQLAEEEEIRRLRKELVPKAQPMPFFDRPFVPKRSSKLQNRSHSATRSGTGCSS